MNNKIYPCFWFDGNAREAADFYCTVFGDANLVEDSGIVVNFEVAGQKFMCLNGGPKFRPNPSISFFVVCKSEREVENAWNKLIEGGEALMPLGRYDWSEKYGWVRDRFGISWQLSKGKMEDVGQKFSPSLLFSGSQHGKAESAVRFYTSVFPRSSITGILKYEKGAAEPEGTVNHAQFSIDSYVLMAMDSSLQHSFGFDEGISLVVECDSQEEIDHYWNALTKDGEESMCGWLKDKYGVSWQVVPSVLKKLMSDPARSQRVVQAFMKMRKFDIQQLLDA